MSKDVILEEALEDSIREQAHNLAHNQLSRGPGQPFPKAKEILMDLARASAQVCPWAKSRKQALDPYIFGSLGSHLLYGQKIIQLHEWCGRDINTFTSVIRGLSFVDKDLLLKALDNDDKNIVGFQGVKKLVQTNWLFILEDDASFQKDMIRELMAKHFVFDPFRTKVRTRDIFDFVEDCGDKFLIDSLTDINKSPNESLTLKPFEDLPLLFDSVGVTLTRDDNAVTLASGTLPLLVFLTGHGGNVQTAFLDKTVAGFSKSIHLPFKDYPWAQEGETCELAKEIFENFPPDADVFVGSISSVFKSHVQTMEACGMPATHRSRVTMIDKKAASVMPHLLKRCGL